MDELSWGEPLAFILVGISISSATKSSMCLTWKTASLWLPKSIPWAVTYGNTQKAAVSRKPKSYAFSLCHLSVILSHTTPFCVQERAFQNACATGRQASHTRMARFILVTSLMERKRLLATWKQCFRISEPGFSCGEGPCLSGTLPRAWERTVSSL